ncbi:MAG: hypothetical protein R2699_12255 [Acidimicrobiales bacterium]
MSGTAEASAAPGTLAKLPSTVRLPVQATIDIAATSADEDVVVISMTETQKVGDPSGPTQDVTQKSQLVVDRSTEANVDDPRSWSVSPDHPSAGPAPTPSGWASPSTRPRRTSSGRTASPPAIRSRRAATSARSMSGGCR